LALCLALALAFVPLVSHAQPEPGAPAEPSGADLLAETTPVVIDGEHLFSVRGISSYPAEVRAEMISRRVREVARDISIGLTAMRVQDGERDTRILVGERPVMTVVDADAELEGIDRQLLAQVYLDKIRGAIASYRAARARDLLLRSAWRAAAATVLAVVTLFVLRRFFRRLRATVERRYRARVRALKVASFELMREERLWGLVEGAVRFLSAAAIVLTLYFYLRYTLALFPWTRGISRQLAAWALAPITRIATAFVAVLPNLFFLAVLFLLTRYLLRAIRLFFAGCRSGEVQLKGFYPEWADPTYKLVRLLVVALAIVVAYPYIPGSDSLAFKGISVFVGVVASLGSSSAISNIIAGYILIYRRVFKVGDVVKVNDVLGRVIEVRLQVTTLRTSKNEVIIVPNSTIVASEVVNYSTLAATEGLILYTTVGINYETPWRQVEAMLLEAAARTPGIKKDPKPFVLQTALGDFAVTHQINVFCEVPRTMTIIYAALHQNILDVFNEYGVQIMTPAYEGDPEHPKIVAREKWFSTPAVDAPGTQSSALRAGSSLFGLPDPTGDPPASAAGDAKAAAAGDTGSA
jgi:small-conductance mechanosensitive channel